MRVGGLIAKNQKFKLQEVPNNKFVQDKGVVLNLDDQVTTRTRLVEELSAAKC